MDEQGTSTGIKARYEKSSFFVRGIRAFVDAQSDVNAILLLDPAPRVEAAYKEMNKALKQKAEVDDEELHQVAIIREYDGAEEQPEPEPEPEPEPSNGNKPKAKTGKKTGKK
jgi:hypothetical protein